jgi:hypothetical protein
MAKGSSQVQVIRRAAAEWEVTRVRELWDNVWDYELIGRVVGAGGLYYAELPEWRTGEQGYTWRRQSRGFALPRGALRVITDPPKKDPATAS